MSMPEPGGHRLTPLPNPAAQDLTTAGHPGAGSPGARGDALDWLFNHLVDGLLHCACAQQAVHPALLDCIAERALRRTLTREFLS